MLAFLRILVVLGIGASLVSAQYNTACISTCLMSNDLESACNNIPYPSNMKCVCGNDSIFNMLISCLTNQCPPSQLDLDKQSMKLYCESQNGYSYTNYYPAATTTTSDGSGGGNGGYGGVGGGGGGSTTAYSATTTKLKLGGDNPSSTNGSKPSNAVGRRADLLGNTGGYGFTALVVLAGAAAGAIAIAL